MLRWSLLMLSILIMLRILSHVRWIARVRLLDSWRGWHSRRWRMTMWRMNKWKMRIWMHWMTMMSAWIIAQRQITLIFTAHRAWLRRHIRRILVTHIRWWMLIAWRNCRRRAHIHRKIDVYTSASRFRIWICLLLLALGWNWDWRHKIRIVMIRPRIMHWIL